MNQKSDTTSSTSTKIPNVKLALEEKYKEESSKLPHPTGWRILVLPFQKKGKTKGGILYTEEAVERATIATVCANVLEVGPLAYADKEKFPTGPWCKKGDWIIFARYSGSRFKIEGGEVRLLNDDEVLATINNPEDILHEF